MTNNIIDTNLEIKLKNRKNKTNILSNKVKFYSTDTKIMSDSLKSKIENIIYKTITENRNYSNSNTNELFMLFIYLTKLTNDIKLYKEVYELYKSHKKLIGHLNNYINMISNNDERNYIYSLLTCFDCTTKTDGYYNDIVRTQLEYEPLISKPSQQFSVDINNDYNSSVCAFKSKLEVLAKKIHEYDFEQNINSKQIVSELLNKINKTYRCFHKFNKPELELYNYIIDLQKQYNNIIYVFSHYTLPITRNGTHHLYADILIVFLINNIIQFAIIEYDGPTHYDTKYYRFTKEIVISDIIKNNFCLRNGIHILRICDTNKKYKDSVLEFIKNIINNTEKQHIKYIPSYEHYSTLLQNK